MKKSIFCLALIFLLTIWIKPVAAQQPTTSAYYFIKPIYAFTGNSSKVSENTATVQGVTYTKGVYGSYGRGWAVLVGFGKMINRNIGFELAGEYLHGKKLKSVYSSDDVSLDANSESKINAAMIKPLLVLRSSGDLLSLYSKLGLAISAWSRRYEKGSLNFSTGGQNTALAYENREKIRGKVGFAAAFGISFRVKEAFAITTELNGQMISLPVRSGSYTKYTVNGSDQLPSMSTSEKSWIYERSTSSAAGSPNAPAVRLFEPANFSYIGISVGLVHYF